MASKVENLNANIEVFPEKDVALKENGSYVNEHNPHKKRIYLNATGRPYQMINKWPL